MRGEATPSQGKEIYILQPRNIKKKTHVNFLSIRGPSKKKKLNISLHIEGFIFRINQSLLAYSKDSFNFTIKYLLFYF